MSVVHATNCREDISDAVLALIDAGTGVADLKLQNTAKTATYATLPFPDPAGTVNATTAVLTFDCSPAIEDTNTSAGTVTKADIDDSDGNTVLSCDVATTGSDINLSNNVFGAGDTVQITSLTYTPPT